jgi:hypothetical protein
VPGSVYQALTEACDANMGSRLKIRFAVISSAVQPEIDRDIVSLVYLRFVVDDIHEHSGRELGVFHAILNLREAGKLQPYEEEQHDLMRQWFSENLEKPRRFTASKPPFLPQTKESDLVVQGQRAESPCSYPRLGRHFAASRGFSSNVEDTARRLRGIRG